MSRNPITRVLARGDAFAMGHALGQASAEALVSRVFATEENPEVIPVNRPAKKMAETPTATTDSTKVEPFSPLFCRFVFIW